MSENTISEIISVSKFPMETVKEYELNKNCEWVKVLLAELNENAEEREPEFYLDRSFLNLKLKIKKKYNAQTGEYLLINGSLETEFFTTCIRTLKEMQDRLELEFKAAFIDEIHADTPEYSELTEVFLDNDVYELYFYSNRQAPLREMIHEQLYLNVNQYPVLDSETPLENSLEKGKNLQ